MVGVGTWPRSLLLVFGAVALGGARASAAAAPPHLVMVMIDDLGWQDVGYHDGSVMLTPTLNEMAGAGVKLENFHVHPVCTPTRAALKLAALPGRAAPAKSKSSPKCCARNCISSESSAAESCCAVVLGASISGLRDQATSQGRLIAVNAATTCRQG